MPTYSLWLTYVPFDFSGDKGGFPGGPVNDEPFWIAAERDVSKASAFYYDDFGNRPVLDVDWNIAPVKSSNDRTMQRINEACITLTRKSDDDQNYIADSISCTSTTKHYVFCMVDASLKPFTTVPTSTTTTTTTTLTTTTIPATTTQPEPVPGQNLPKMPCISAPKRKKRATTSNEKST